MWTRDLRLLTGAIFLSSAGDLLALIVLALRVHDLTGSGIAVSALVGSTLLPSIAVAPLAGLVADRFESVRVVATASIVQAGVAVALAFTGDFVAILILACLLTASNAFSQPAEFTLVTAVGARDVTHATGVVEAARYAGFAMGPLFAAVLSAVGPTTALLANAASFVAIAWAVTAMQTRRPAAPAAARERSRALDGVRLLAGDRVLRTTLGSGVAGLLFISAALTAEIFYVKDVIGATDAGYALVVGAWMVGMVAGASSFARRVPSDVTAVGMLFALGVQGLGMGIQTVWAILPVAIAGYVLGGIGHGVKNVLLRALIAERVPDDLRGRVFAANNAASGLAELTAVAAGGLLVAGLGARLALVIAGAGPMLAATFGLIRLRQGSLRQSRVDSPIG